MDDAAVVSRLVRGKLLFFFKKEDLFFGIALLQLPGRGNPHNAATYDYVVVAHLDILVCWLERIKIQTNFLF